jgi:hypothetical protein
MMWAANGQISTDPVKGGIEITAEQYQAALEGVIAGKVVTVVGGVLRVDFPPPATEPDAPSDPAPPTVEDYRAALNQHIDAVAQSRDFDNGVVAASWTGSSVKTWAADAQAFVTWRDAVWLHAYAVFAGEDRPAVHDFINALPAIVWPIAALPE